MRRKRLPDDDDLQLETVERLRRAEVALATAESTAAAARELVDHAIALLGASAAVVLIEGEAGTIRVAGGDADAVYRNGSRMRLLEVDGTPVGSIAVGPPTSREPYRARDERVLDALGQSVSSALHRLSLFEQVRSERRTLGDVVTSSSDGIFSAGPDNRVRTWNPAMERITGLAARRALGEQCCAVFKPHDAEGTALHGTGCPGRLGVVIEARLVRLVVTSGEERWLACTWSPMHDGGHVVVARDFTAQKRVEDLKADFLATISHELRTPLTPIRGFVDTLLRQDERFEPDERRRIYQLVLQQTGRLERLVKDLLFATSLDDPAGLPVAERLDWAATVAETVEDRRRQDPSRDIELDSPGALPFVLADRERATTVLSNVLDNAARYTPPGTPVAVRLDVDGHHVATTVEDEGEGVRPEERELVFERFTRLGDHLTREQGGPGLGLYIARRLVEAMGGRMGVGESPAGGAAFRFTLPGAPSAAPHRPRPPEPLRTAR